MKFTDSMRLMQSFLSKPVDNLAENFCKETFVYCENKYENC